jgi:hypothetical protein
MSGARIRQKFAKKRSLHGVNEHFSQIFNAIIVPRSNRAKVSYKIGSLSDSSNRSKPCGRTSADFLNFEAHNKTMSIDAAYN